MSLRNLIELNMVLPRGRWPRPVGFALSFVGALLAAACGGSDLVDSPDTGRDASVFDATSDQASPPFDGTPPGGDASDSAPPEVDHADAADADIRDSTSAVDAAAGLDAGPDGEAGGSVDAGDGGIGLLASAKRFAVLAGSTVIIAPSPPMTTIVGDVGVSPGTAIATLGPGQPVGGAVHAGDPVAAQAQSDLTKAYNTLAGMACLPANDRTGVDLGGKTLAPGVYCFPNTSAGITGTLVLDAQLDRNATWVFQVGSTLTTATNATVTVINGGSACNVYWQIGSSATLGTGTVFAGNIVALTSITLVTGSTVAVGRTLARNGAVTLNGNTVSAAACP